MQAADSVKLALDYIEQNLKTTITAEELADMAGYSAWHYCRMFAQVTGMTVAYYIRKRRLDSAFMEISNGRKAIDVVLEYGFDTYPGFYKAFVRTYGCSPKKYLSLYGKNLLSRFGGFTMINEHDLRAALSNWNVRQDLPLRDLYIMDGSKVSGNDWALGDEYILKIGERDRLLKDLHLQKALAKQGFLLSAPIATKSGAEYLDGASISILMKKTPGGPLGKDDRFGKNRRDFGFKYGAGIAKLHRALSDVERDILPDDADLYGQISEWAMPAIKKQNEQYEMGLFDSFFEDYARSFGMVFNKLPKQLIHRDPNPSNILFDGGDVSGFINFDLSERNIRLWDPCYCATGILIEWRGIENIYEKWPDIIDGILHGYDSVNALTQDEKQAVFYVICSIQMICAAWFGKQDGDEYKELAKTNREMLSFIVENKKRIMDIF
ncbi:MAG: helix-turn-helix domain-containing protein [Oscillospiraceae bacterium]|jgi:AraC-like DNA-binding protein/Ser/Thr protein kinase RdoA (MazF antagonist)|nr:helix-turn-helix domain-containing protein [Oscillospiraceae bacterium]